MGDPRKTRKKYQTPGHPWNKDRIEQEKVLRKEYGLKNKQEIWKMESVLRNAKTQAKILSRTRTEQARQEEQALLTKLQLLGVVSADSNLDNILALDVKEVLERRLQTQLFKQMLANSMKQARQYIVHGHVTVAGKVITSPSYLVSVKEAGIIEFHERSALVDPEHPERVAAKKETPEELELKAKEKDKKQAEEKMKKAEPKKKKAKVESKEQEKKESVKQTSKDKSAKASA